MTYNSMGGEYEECGNTNEAELYLIPHPTDKRWKTICNHCLAKGREKKSMKCIHDDEKNYSCIECQLFEECWVPIIRGVNKKLAEIEKLQALQIWKRLI